MSRESIKIRAFGPCMIGGYPHHYDNSFFHLAMQPLQQQTEHNLIPSITTLGGFPVTRVLKHSKTRCLDADPDIVVVQFGSSDSIVRTKKDRQKSNREVSTASLRPIDWLRWYIQGIIGDALQLEPVTAPEIYIETVGRIVHAISEHGTSVVVLSPFIMGGKCSDRIARNCVPRLEEIVAAIPRCHYVNAYAVLDKHPRSQMLLRDGTHLSLNGHDVVSGCLFETLVEVIESIKRPAPPLIFEPT